MVPGFGKLVLANRKARIGRNPADRRAHQDPGEARVQVPPRQEPQGHGAWEEVMPAGAAPSPTTRRMSPLPHPGSGSRRPLARLAATLPRVWQGIGYRPLPTRARPAALRLRGAALAGAPRIAGLGRFVATPPSGERLVGALVGEAERARVVPPRPGRHRRGRPRWRSRPSWWLPRSITPWPSAWRRSSPAPRGWTGCGCASVSSRCPRARCPWAWPDVRASVSMPGVGGSALWTLREAPRETP